MSDSSVVVIGAILGDSDRSSLAWGEAIGRLSQKAEQATAGVSSPIRINIVLCVDGRIVPLTFTGVRTGSYFKKTNTLTVQAAITGGEASNKRQVLTQAVADAIDEAERWMQRKRIGGTLDHVREATQSLIHTS